MSLRDLEVLKPHLPEHGIKGLRLLHLQCHALIPYLGGAWVHEMYMVWIPLPLHWIMPGNYLNKQEHL